MRPLSLLLVAAFVMPAHAQQVWEDVATEPATLDSARNQALGFDLDALAFFRDNEYDSPIQKGYSLPGFWLRPKLTFQTLHKLRFEIGLHATVFNGANKYPNYAYHDVAHWKGSQYQRGAHVLPWFRLQANLKHTTLVLGDIYGAQNHRLVLPLYNPEQNLSCDPETGFQILVSRRHIALDTWVNWQSYQFELDSHQEAFTVGTNATILWGNRQKALRWSTPVQLLIQHRGGEQDTSHTGVQTLANASAGLRLDYVPRSPRALSSLNAQVNVLGSYQQSGELWPFTTGMALHAAVGARLWNRLTLELGHFSAPKQYANLYGTPFMGTLSIKKPGVHWRGTHTTYLNAAYTYRFSPAYALSAQAEVMNVLFGGSNRQVFSFGVCFRVRPSFLIKRWS